MSSPILRLRLSICRYAVPEVKIVWPCTATKDLTVAQLVGQVNNVVPLESGEWGLEDYVVELVGGGGSAHSFECLHYQAVETLFRDGDEVL